MSPERKDVVPGLAPARTPDPGEAVPRFLLGAGCQKGGTSWLHSYLVRSPMCSPAFAKELTVFDVLDVPEHTWQARRTFERAQRDLESLSRGESSAARTLHRAAMIADPTIYFDYVASLVHRPGRSFTMDLSPNYALLAAPRFAQIRDELTRRGVETRAVMLLRDPVDRVWSQVRMHLRQRRRREPGRPHRLGEAELVVARHRRPTVELRTRYETTLRTLDSVFDPGTVHVELYERLFEASSIEAMCAFVGIEAHPADVGRRVNASPRESETLPDDVVATVARFYEPTYRAVADRLGLPDMRRHWPSARFLD